MRSPLVYLTATKLKNQLKSVLKSPAKLIYGLILLALLVFSSFSGKDAPAMAPRDSAELTAIVTAFYTVMFLMIFATGSGGSGTSMFNLSDAMLLFPAPLKPNRVLFYGLLRQLTLSLLLGFFLLFQYSWLNRLYGVSYFELVLIIIGYALCLFFAQLLAMTVYTRTAGNPQAKAKIKYFVYGGAALYLGWAVYSNLSVFTGFSGGSFDPILSALIGFFSTLPGLLFPVSGWAAGLFQALRQGDLAMILLFTGLLCASFGVIILLLVKCKNNYYEDALATAETSHSAITAQKEGRVGEVVPQKVRVGKIGLGKGMGAAAIYQKHRVENRRSGVFFLNNMSLLFMAIILIMCFFMKELGFAFVLGFSTYTQLFTVALGRFSRELTKPYIYLMPEPPLKKLLYAIKENLISEAFEAVVLFTLAALILGASPLDAVGCILARISFSFLFTAANLVVERVFGSVSSKALIFLFYFLVILVLCLPALALIILTGIILPIANSLLVVLVPLCIGNIITSLFAFYLCRNVLQYVEFNGR